MPNDSTRTVLVALGAGLGVALAKVGAAVLTGSAALAAEAAHSLADSGNDLSLYVAQRRSSRPPDDQHPLGYGPRSGVVPPVGGADDPAGTPLPQGVPGGDPGDVGPLAAGCVRRGRGVRLGDVIAFAALALNQITGSFIPQGVAAVLIALVLIRVSPRLIQRSHDFLVGSWAGVDGGPQGNDVAGYGLSPGLASKMACVVVRSGHWRMPAKAPGWAWSASTLAAGAAGRASS
jgi:hypothetical protein